MKHDPIDDSELHKTHETEETEATHIIDPADRSGPPSAPARRNDELLRECGCLPDQWKRKEPKTKNE